jgi:hypothetical protein
MQTQIQCFKYNNSLDKRVQKTNCFDSFLTLSSDGKKLLITNRITVTGMDDTNFASETAIKLVPNLGEKATINNVEYQIKPEPQGLNKEVEKFDMEEKFRQAYLLPDKDSQFQNVLSNSSCFIKDITSFVFGGFSSRFWILRKHINSMPANEQKHLPFYSWHCITIKTINRDIDLVIKDDEQMRILIKFLVYSIDTLDG